MTERFRSSGRFHQLFPVGALGALAQSCSLDINGKTVPVMSLGVCPRVVEVGVFAGVFVKVDSYGEG